MGWLCLKLDDYLVVISLIRSVNGIFLVSIIGLYVLISGCICMIVWIVVILGL